MWEEPALRGMTVNLNRKINYFANGIHPSYEMCKSNKFYILNKAYLRHFIVKTLPAATFHNIMSIVKKI